MNRQVKIFSIFLLFALPNISCALASFKNSIFAEALGNAGYYSINYERQLKHQIVARLGFSALSDGLIIFPVTLGKFWGEDKHHFEFAGGVDFSSSDNDIYDNQIIVTGFLGYRYQKPDGRFLLRIGLTPLWNDGYFLLSGGVSMGYRF